MLTSLMADMKTKEWVQFLPRIQCKFGFNQKLLHNFKKYYCTVTMNTQSHETIKTTPYQVVFGLSPSSEPVKGLCVAEEESISHLEAGNMAESQKESISIDSPLEEQEEQELNVSAGMAE